MYERSTGQLVAEVLRTTKGPVVVHRVAAIETESLGQPYSAWIFGGSPGSTA